MRTGTALLALALTACAAGNTYRVAAPEAWRSLSATSRDTLAFSQMIVDRRFARCPGSETLSFGRASYRRKAAEPGAAGDGDFLGMATALLTELHEARRNPPPRTALTAEIVSVAGHRAARISWDVAARGGGFCGPGEAIDRMRERTLLVDSGGRGLGLSLHAGLHAQKFVVLHYEAPAARFEEGLAEFERIANSLDFIGG